MISPALISPGSDDVVLIDIERVFAALVVIEDVVTDSGSFAFGAIQPSLTLGDFRVKATNLIFLRITRIGKSGVDKAINDLGRIRPNSRDGACTQQQGYASGQND
jgi:hypothetical protein